LLPRLQMARICFRALLRGGARLTAYAVLILQAVFVCRAEDVWPPFHCGLCQPVDYRQPAGCFF
jgi:hypothetical protein